MSSETFGNMTISDILDTAKNGDVDCMKAESQRLMVENAGLRKLMGLVQENVELRYTLKDYKTKIQGPAPPRKPKEVSKDSEKVKKCQKLVGEIAFRLDRRILSAVFSVPRLYGYHVANIKDKILQVATCSQTGRVNEELKFELTQRYYHLMDQLKKFGYDRKVHPYFTEHLVNAYGVMKEKTAFGTEEMSSLNDPQFLSDMITECMPGDTVKDILIILNCLTHLAKQNGSSSSADSCTALFYL